MRKSILLLLVVSLAAFNARAQFRFGAKAGISTNFVSADVLKYVVKDNALGFYVGPTAEYLFTERIGVDAGVFYSQKSIEVLNSDSYALGYIDVPVNFKYFFPLSDGLKIFAAAGPYARFKVTGDDSFPITIDDVQGEWDTRSMSAGMNFTGGVQLFRILQVGITFGLGMSDSFVDSGGSFSAQERAWSFAAAVYF